MSKANKRIKFLEMLWGCYYDRFTPNDKDKAMLTEIKKKLEIYEQLFGDELIEIQEQLSDDDLVEKEALDYLEYWTSSCEADCSENQCPVGIKDALKECHLAYDKIRKLLPRQPGGVICNSCDFKLEAENKPEITREEILGIVSELQMNFQPGLMTRMLIKKFKSKGIKMSKK